MNKDENRYYQRKINYYETDQMSIVHHSNYIRFMEEARLFHFNNSGISYTDLEKRGIYIPVLTVNCEYRKACLFDQTLLINVIPVFFNGIKMKFKYEIFVEGDNVLHAKGETEHCFINKERKPIYLKKEFPQIYQIFLQWFENNKVIL